MLCCFVCVIGGLCDPYARCVAVIMYMCCWYLCCVIIIMCLCCPFRFYHKLCFAFVCLHELFVVDFISAIWCCVCVTLCDVFLVVMNCR